MQHHKPDFQLSKQLLGKANHFQLPICVYRHTQIRRSPELCGARKIQSGTGKRLIFEFYRKKFPFPTHSLCPLTRKANERSKRELAYERVI
jgi:hypothetical protein